MKVLQLFALMMMVVSAAPHPSPALPSHDNQVMEEGNSTRNGTMNTTYSVPTRIRCFLPTCGTVNLGSSLQRGDEKAGGATSDPYGNGKK